MPTCREIDRLSFGDHRVWRTRFSGREIEFDAVVVNGLGKHLCRHGIALAVEPATLCLRVVVAGNRKIVLQDHRLRMDWSKLGTRRIKTQRKRSGLVCRERRH